MLNRKVSYSTIISNRVPIPKYRWLKLLWKSNVGVNSYYSLNEYEWKLQDETDSIKETSIFQFWLLLFVSIRDASLSFKGWIFKGNFQIISNHNWNVFFDILQLKNSIKKIVRENAI